jgi:hypothetical protein
MMLLTVELRDGDKPGRAEVALCLDDEGLEVLVRRLERLRGRRDHEHLMTPAWAGSELTDSKQGGPEFELVNHLRIVKL